MAVFTTPPWLRPENEATKPAFLAWVVTGMACMSLYIDTFQSTMVNFGLSSIMSSMDMTPFDINWIVIAYSLAFAAVLPISGAIADRFGLRFGFVMGTGTLTWASALCAAAPNKYALIVGRAFCGIGAALGTATGPPIISHLFTDEKQRNKGLSLLIMHDFWSIARWQVPNTLSRGEKQTDPRCSAESSTGWRALFWLGLAVNSFLCVVGFLTIPAFATPPPDPSKKFDAIGLCIFITGLPLLIYGVDDGGNRGWTKPEILVPLILGGLLVIAFPIYERRIDNPLIPKHFLFDPNMMLILITFVIFGGGFSTWFLLVTQVFLNSLELTALRSALYLLTPSGEPPKALVDVLVKPAAVGSIVSGALGSYLSTRTPVRIQIGGAYFWTAAFLVPWGLIVMDANRAYIICFAILYLFGNAPAIVRAQATTLSTIPSEQHGQATAMLMVSFQGGNAVMLALVNVVAKGTTKGPETAASLLEGYKAGFWLLLGLTTLVGIVFVVVYRDRPVKQPDAEMRLAASSATEVSTSGIELAPENASAKETSAPHTSSSVQSSVEVVSMELTQKA
ncbi:major facilitator superfamily domain-containing protein [Phyllosticta citrichinensis]|uniref:Major facilitator superfamily domain-containing protein n=1 Tax=Phyllosticta citrichinensis TaxID=1130410 RepID=A0ABR1XJW2_9PEZI